MHLGLARAAQAAFGVVADDVGNRPADTDQPVGVVEQFQVATVPGHQAQRLVDHADALADVLDGPLQQGAVELQHLGGFIGDAYHVLQLHVAAFDGRLDHGAGRGGAEHAGQQALGVLDPFAVGVLVGVEALALAIGEADEALARTLFADKARGQ
uniref:DhaL domain-containing protein n=1 Tax=Steinernema glaseri TaxID=37863 RepID=A0A1I7Y3B3_9BILA